MILFRSSVYFFILVWGLQTLPTHHVRAQSVAPDGTTSTNVTSDASGKVTVTIAPADSRSISHNKYDAFSVLEPGVDLDNRSVGAGTILNEVTSNNPTKISGALSVLGPEAHVIVANPNGIAVDGGRFINTGNVALTTGRLSFDALGRPVSTVEGGVISVGPGGLSGVMDELHLIAQSVGVDGQVVHDNQTTASLTSVTAGRSVSRFDAAAAAGGIFPWAQLTSAGGEGSSNLVVDITEQAGIRSGRLSITVTEQGAGVRSSGALAATAGGFRITGNGRLELSGSVSATQSVNITGNEISLLSGNDPAQIVSSASGVVLEATGGDIDLGNSRIEGQIVASDNLASSGGVTLIAGRDIFQSVGNDDVPAEIISNEEALVLFAGGRIDIENARFTSQDDLRLSAIDSINLNTVNVAVGDDFRILSDGPVAIASSIANAAGDVRIDGSSVQIGEDVSSTNDLVRTEIIAANGGVTIKADDGDIKNYGGLIQGGERASGDEESLGGVSILAEGDLINRSLSVDHLAVLFGERDDLFISVNGDVRNETGRLFSNLGISLEADGDFINTTVFDRPVDPFHVAKKSSGRSARSLFLRKKKTTSYTANYGSPVIADELALIVAVDNLDIDVNSFLNDGGDISGRDVTFDVKETFQNKVKLTGSLSFAQSCGFFCKSSGTNSVSVFGGGAIDASSDLLINAGTSVLNVGGQLSGLDSLQLVSPETVSRSVSVPLILERPSGLTGFFQGRRAWLGETRVNGLFGSLNGDVTFDGDVDFSGTPIVSQSDPVITGDNRTIDITPPVPRARQPLGVLGRIL